MNFFSNDNDFDTLEKITGHLVNIENSFPKVILEYKKDINEKYKTIEELGGGKSGAEIRKITDETGSYILKTYNEKFIKSKGHRVIREVFAYIKITNEFHKSKRYNKYKEYINFAQLIRHGTINIDGKDSYFIIITEVKGIPLFNSVTQSKNKIWKNLENIQLFSKYLIESLKILYGIFGDKFIHHDMHPDNIFIELNDNKLKSITLIDFDLIDSDYFQTVLGVSLPIDVELSRNNAKLFNLGLYGFTTKIRQFICFCNNYTKYESIDDLNKINAISFDCAFNDFSQKIGTININNVDIKHWYFICKSLILLNNILSPLDFKQRIEEFVSYIAKSKLYDTALTVEEIKSYIREFVSYIANFKKNPTNINLKDILKNQNLNLEKSELDFVVGGNLKKTINKSKKKRKTKKYYK